jgi:integrase/recombinase XerD
MIEGILQEPLALTRHRTAPLLRERELFLSHLLRQGTSHRRVRSIAAYLIHIVRLMGLTSLREVEVREIEKAGDVWANYRGPHRRMRAGRAAAFCFTNVAKKWFRFHGRLTILRAPAHPFSEHIRDFIEFMRSTQGLSPDTIRGYSSRAGVFLKWLASRHEAFSSVSLQDVDDFLETKAAGEWRPGTLASQGQALRAFFGHAATRGWCTPGIGRGIRTPAIPKYDGLLKGPSGRKSGDCSIPQVGRSRRRSAREPSYRYVRSMRSEVVKWCGCA